MVPYSKLMFLRDTHMTGLLYSPTSRLHMNYTDYRSVSSNRLDTALGRSNLILVEVRQVVSTRVVSS
jgi:hypothetical protein